MDVVMRSREAVDEGLDEEEEKDAKEYLQASHLTLQHRYVHIICHLMG